MYIPYSKSYLVDITPEPWPTIPLLSTSKCLLHRQLSISHQNSSKPPRQQDEAGQLSATPLCIESDTMYGDSAATQNRFDRTSGFACELEAQPARLVLQTSSREW
jgi:hypothetical protein